MTYVPWPGFGPFESYDADETVAGGERLELAGFEIDVVFTPGHSPGHVTYAIARRGRACSAATSSSRARSAASTCPAATGRRCAGLRSRPCSTPIRTETVVYPGHMGMTTLGRRARRQPVPGRARLTAAAEPRRLLWRRQAPGTEGHLRRPARPRRPPGAVLGHAAQLLGAAGYGRHRDAALRGDRAVRARRRREHRHRQQGDVHLRGPRRPLA